MATTPLANSEIADILSYEMTITPGCPDDAEDAAQDRAKIQILEVLDELDKVDIRPEHLKERAAFFMGQYAFDAMCGLSVAGYGINMSEYPLDQRGQQEYQGSING